MSKRRIALTSVGLTVVIGLLVGQSAIAQSERLGREVSPREGRLILVAKEAKIRGLKKVTLEAEEPFPTGVFTVDEVFRAYSVVVAEPIAKRVLSDPEGIETWYKLRVLETLSGQPSVPQGDLPIRVPSEFLPLRQGEILVAESGGTVVIDGVTITEKAPCNFVLNVSEKYLLILYMESSGAYGQLVAGSASAFLITPERELAALTKPDSPLAKDINAHYNNRLDWLRDDAMRRASR